MKDVVHHLKYLQKKVIQSSKKADAENSLNNRSIAQAIPTEVSPVHKKKSFNTQLRKSYMSLHVH